MAKANQKHSNGTVLNFNTQLGRVIHDAMGAIERENPTLEGILPRDYAWPSCDTAMRGSANLDFESHWRDFRGAEDHIRLGGLVDIISNIGFNESAAKSKDVFGRVYEYFLGKFASAEGKGGGEFYTPQCVVRRSSPCWNPTKAACSRLCRRPTHSHLSIQIDDGECR
jgi:type I restriction enzyme M protein